MCLWAHAIIKQTILSTLITANRELGAAHESELCRAADDCTPNTHKHRYGTPHTRTEFRLPYGEHDI